jgi:hypothetical protein
MFTHARTGIVVEIQWDIVPRFFSLTLDRDGLERRLVTTTILGMETRTLSAEDLLFVLCVHGGKHAWSRLEWVCGVAELLRVHPQLQWDLVVSLAARAGAIRMLLLGLTLARDLLEADLPAAINRMIDADAAVAALAADTLAQMFSDRLAAQGAFARARVQMRMRERWSDRIRYGVRLSSTPSARDWAILPASPASRALAYPVRMTRLAAKYLGSHLTPSKRQW